MSRGCPCFALELIVQVNGFGIGSIQYLNLDASISHSQSQLLSEKQVGGELFSQLIYCNRPLAVTYQQKNT